MAVFARGHGSLWPGLAGQWPIWIPAAAALGLYALVYVESRFVAPFFVLIWMSLFSGLKFPKTQTAQILTRCLTMAMVVTLGAGIVWLTGRSLFRALAPEPFVDWEVAEGLHEMGIQPGDGVASIGWGIYGYWAHLAGVRIVAEVPPDGAASYWSSSPNVQSEVLADFAMAGARVVVIGEKPPSWLDPNWREIGHTDYFVRGLNAASPSWPPSR